MKKLLLLVVAFVAACLLFGFGFLTWCVMRFVKDSRETYAAGGWNYFFEIAYALDVLGNAVCCELFNVVLLKHGSGYRFGRRAETISSVLGKNQQAGTLSATGQFFRKLIDRIDPVPNHCVRNIQTLQKL